MGLKEMDLGIRDNSKEKEQYEVLQTLTKLFNGIHGRLCDLVEVRQKKFETAVSVGLGINNFAAIVENKQTAIQCMEHMRKIRRGNFRFLPLNDIKTSQVSQQIRRFGGSSQAMMDVINYDERFERAIQFALSNTIVVDKIDEARAIRNNSQFNTSGIRIVSLDGSVIQPNGNISGGYFEKRSHRAFNIKDKAKKQRVRDKLLEQLKEIDDELIGNDDDDESGDNMDEYELENSLNDLQNKQKNKEFRMETLKKQLIEKQAMLKALNKDLKKKKKEAEAAKAERNECDEEIIEIENEIFDEYAKDLGVATMREYEESKLKLIEERTAKKKELNAELTEIENKVKFLSRKNEMNEDQMQEISKRLKKIKKEIKEIESEEEEAKNEEIKSDQIQKDTKKKRKIVSDKNKEIIAKKNEIQKQHREKSNLRGFKAKMFQKYQNIESEAKHQNIDLNSSKQQRSKKRKRNKNKNKNKLCSRH